MMQSDTKPKFCKDCKHFLPAAASLVFGVGTSRRSMCDHPENMSAPDLVSGERYRISNPADLRKPDAICGPDGAMFEARPPEPPPEPKPTPGQIVLIDPPAGGGFWDFFRF